MKKHYLLFAFIVCSLSAMAQGSIGLVAHWNFNGNANDVSGNGLHGVVTGATLTAGYGGLANTAYLFRGAPQGVTYDNISIPHDPLMDVQYYSICAFVKVDSFYSGQCQGGGILWKGTQGNSDFLNMALSDNSYDGDCFTFSPNNIALQSDLGSCGFYYPWSSMGPSGNYISTGKWYCFVSIFDGINISTYVDGVLYHQLPYTTALTPGTEGMSIGTSMFSTAVADWSSYPFYGTIDDIKLYSRALSINEADMFCEEVKRTGDDGGNGNGGGTDWPTSVNSISNDLAFALVPNPASNQVQVILQNSTNGEARLLNAMGQVLAKKTIAGNATQFDLNMYTPGLYMIRLDANGQTIIKKFIKQ